MVRLRRVRERAGVFEHADERDDIVLSPEREVVQVADVDGEVAARLVAVRRNLRAARRDFDGVDTAGLAAERARDRAAAAADLEHRVLFRQRQPRQDVLPLLGKMIQHGPTLILVQHLVPTPGTRGREQLVFDAAVAVLVARPVLRRVERHLADAIAFLCHRPAP